MATLPSSHEMMAEWPFCISTQPTAITLQARPKGCKLVNISLLIHTSIGWNQKWGVEDKCKVGPGPYIYNSIGT
jgi:hypothetical protein